MPINMLYLSLLTFCHNSVAKHSERVDRLICTSVAKTQYLCFTVMSKNLIYLLPSLLGKLLERNVNCTGLLQECVYQLKN